MKKAVFEILAVMVIAAGCATQRVPQSAREGESNAHATKTFKIKDNTNYSNIYDYLRGRVAGVQVNGTQITIRGVNSVNCPSSPLILVDGMEMKDISSISPSDVERVEVLKDSAAAIYGFRGTGGVIKITLKKGR